MRPASGSGPLPPLAQGGEVLEAELWRWADLTPEAFLERYHKASYAPKEGLAAWIEAGVRRGRLDLEAWQPVLEILGSP
ncbi:hypothetical protein [Thermus caldilimi]|uniref:hypothetical protein n=1 Tax=Thermus caldilimi TaxID=2483360 RepID=UPI001076A38B|nr:hypothetical protein [Thermus caldilimi]